MATAMTFKEEMKRMLGRMLHLNVFILGWTFLNFALILLFLRSGITFGIGNSVMLLAPIVVGGAFLRERSWRRRELLRGNDLGPVTAMSVLWGLALYAVISGLTAWLIATVQAPALPTDEFQMAVFLLCAPTSFLVMTIVDDLIPGPRLFRWSRWHG